jgi:hypothetical protein
VNSTIRNGIPIRVHRRVRYPRIPYFPSIMWQKNPEMRKKSGIRNEWIQFITTGAAPPSLLGPIIIPPPNKMA